MKRNCFVVLILLFCLLLMVVSSCDDTVSNQNLSGFGSISMTIDDFTSKTIQPETSQLLFVSYRIVGRKSTAETATVDRSFTEKTVKIDNLEAGKWLFYVEGYNENHILLGKSDLHEVIIERNKTIKESYILKKIEGQGVLSLIIKTQMSRVASITCTLEQDGREPVVLSLTKNDSVLGDDGFFTFSKSFSVQQGEYNSTIVMKDDDDVVIGKALYPSVHIYSELESDYVFSWNKLQNLLPAVDNPVPSIESGRYPTGSEVSFSTEEEGTVIYYSTGGAYSVYQGPISINQNTTLSVFASKANMNQSETRTYSYVCKVNNPEISMASGSFSSEISHSVTISESDQNAVIYYTLDGSDPLTSSTRIEYNGSISISTNTDLKVVATEEGYTSSDVIKASYRYKVPNPTISLEYGSFSSVISKTVTIECADSDATVYYTMDGTDPLTSETRTTLPTNNQITIERTCTLRVIACSEGCTTSEEVMCSLVFEVPAPVISLASGSFSSAESKDCNITCSDSDAAIYYTLDGTDPLTSDTRTALSSNNQITIDRACTLRVVACSEGCNPSREVTRSYVFDVPTPVVSLASGSFSSAESKNCTITCSDSDAIVYYTLDGTDPLTSDTRTALPANSQITIDRTCTLRVVACSEGCTSSEEVTRNYLFDVPTPVILLASGSFSSAEPKECTITCFDSDAVIYYTLDSTDPLSSDTRTALSANSQITIDRTCILRVIACSEDCTYSGEVTCSYVFEVPAPVISLASGSFSSAESKDCTITCSDSDAVIYYTLDGTDPLTSDTRFSFSSSKSISISQTIDLRVVACSEGCTTSEEVTRSYDFVVPTPVISLASGAYYDGQELVLSSTLAGATIYYTLDGSNPTINSSIYSDIIVLNRNCTVSAIAVLEGMTNSSVVSQNYIIKVKSPVISPEPCSYEGSKTITISCGTEDASIYYTLDGNNPTSSSGILYTGPFDIDNTASFKIIAIKTNLADSDVVEGTFTRSGATSDDGVFYVTADGVLSVAEKNNLPNSVVIPNSINGITVRSIAGYAFQDCTGLTSIVLPDSVTSIGEGAFKGCSSLVEMTLPFVGGSPTASDYTRVFGYVFGCDSSSSSGAIYQGVYPYYYYIPSSLRTVTITNQETIPANAFYGCTMLTSVVLGDKTTAIERYSFYKCTGLAYVTIPNGVTSIGEYAFRGCSGLTSVTLPSGLTTIGNYAFYGCSGLTSVTLPSGLTTIGNYAFSECRGLTSIVVPDSVTSIGDGAFIGCSNIVEITLPFVGGSPTASDYDRVFGYIFGYSTYSTSGTNQGIPSYYYFVPLKLRTVTITNQTTIPANAFYGCTKLTSVVLGDKTTVIGDYAFYNCSGLTEVSFNNANVSLGSHVFDGTSISNPTTVTTYSVGDIGPAGGYIFYDCDADNDSGNADSLISSECGWRYLEAAPYDYGADSGRMMYGTVVPIGAYRNGTDSGSTYLYVNGSTSYNASNCTLTGIGTGKDNTSLIVNALQSSAYTYSRDDWYTTSYYAAKLADNYSYGGYDDWFLPSIDELLLLCKGFVSGIVKGPYYRYVSDLWYISSSEVESKLGAVWTVDIIGSNCGKISTIYGDNEGYMRLIRRF